MSSPSGDRNGPIGLRPLLPEEMQQLEDLRWAADAPEVQQHVGKLVAVRRKRILGIGTDSESLVEQAAAQEGCPWWEVAVIEVPSLEL